MLQIQKLLKIANQHGLYPQPPKVTVAPSDPDIELEHKHYVNFASNNYLGLANHPEVKRAVIEAVEQYGVGTCASRMAIGNTEAHL
ncbi:MAG: 8-amino-7-oxononanoate synthase, partial [Patescibacteria group bacterium]